ncbi:hypothetical protein [Pseudomonas sp. 44 R 15]|nr:hypothetical protein [Pseudomonas sp. 44 R 15]
MRYLVLMILKKMLEIEFLIMTNQIKGLLTKCFFKKNNVKFHDDLLPSLNHLSRDSHHELA